MTDRYKGLVVTLDRDYRDDDAQSIIDAIRMIRGVVDVEPVLTDALNDQIITMRVETQIRERVYNALRHGGDDDA
jgi:hypothetical protein